jgi:radical SAM superfamily enzyme YgiQ (UPF0313 family)
MTIALITLFHQIMTLGALNVSTHLRHNGYPNCFLYFPCPRGEKIAPEKRAETVSFLKALNPRIIGISLTTYYFAIARGLTIDLKKELPSTLVVWGGVHPTLLPDECLKYCDVACLGEGEEAFLDLVRAIDHGRDFLDIESLWIKDSGTIRKNQIRCLCQDLDSRPFPAVDWDNTFITHGLSVVPLTRQLFDKYRPKQGTAYEVMASRGCPFSCTYCCNSAFGKLYKGKGRMLRFRSVDHVVEELQYVKTTFPRVKAIDFEDDALGIAPDEYLEAFGDTYKTRIGLPFHMRVVPRMVTERKIEILKKAGLVGAVMGLQGGDRMNKEIYKRPTSQRDFIDTAKLLRKHKVIGRYDAIIDNPYSCEDDEVEAIRTFMAVPKPFHLYVYPLGFFEGTELTEMARRDGKYDPETAGYEHHYGTGKHLFPYLARIIVMTPFTPRFMIATFLAVRRFRVGRCVIWLHYRLVFGSQGLLIKWAMKNVGRLLFLRKLLLR